MTAANKLSETEVERVDAVDRPATGLKFVIRKYAAEPLKKEGPEIQVGDALPGNDDEVEGGITDEDGELADGSDLVQKIAKAVAAELAPGLDKLAEAIEASGIVKVQKTAAKSQQAKGSDSTTKTEVKKRGEGLFTNIIFGQK